MRVGGSARAARVVDGWIVTELRPDIADIWDPLVCGCLLGLVRDFVYVDI
jgi:hypothetical protein